MKKKIAWVGIFVCAVISCMAHIGCTAPKEYTLPAEKHELYRAVIQQTSDIKSAQYPLKRHIAQRTKIRFTKASFDVLKNYKTAIIVLGSKPLDKETPTFDLVYRVLTALDLSRSYPQAIIVMSGGETVKGISEAEMMGVMAWSRGMDTGKIILEEDSRTTKENARFCARIFEHIPLERVFLISRKDHLRRALLCFWQYAVFQHSQGVDCGITLEQTITQIEEYLRHHHDPVVAERLKRLQKQQKESIEDKKKDVSQQ